MLRIADIMTRDVVTLPASATLREATELFAERHMSGAPVLEGNEVVGVISVTDVMQYIAERTLNAELEEPEEDGDGDAEGDFFQLPPDELGADLTTMLSWKENNAADILSRHTVDEVMTRSLLAMTPRTDVTAAADYMRRTGVHRLLVIEDKRLLGIISTMDIVRAVAEHRLEVRRLVFDRSPV